jgi:hypothetical protein
LSRHFRIPKREVYNVGLFLPKRIPSSPIRYRQTWCSVHGSSRKILLNSQEQSP